jgi:hypothetical protein
MGAWMPSSRDRRRCRFVAFTAGIALLAAPGLSLGAESAPDFSGLWGRNAFDFEPAPSGPRPITNLMRLPDGTQNNNALVGDYRNPILKREAAEALRERGAMSLTGKPFPDPSNQCAPWPPVFAFAMQLGVQIMRRQDDITLLYNQDDQVRHVRLNGTHPRRIDPSWKGDSVAHYEGDTLVIDTVGVKPGPLGMVDRFGTPGSDALHVIERYRLIDGRVARESAERHQKENGAAGLGGAVAVDRDDSGPGLQLQFTVEDPKMFTTPWSAVVTYRRQTGPWQEQICAENPNEYYAGRKTAIPTAARADF